MFTNKFFVVAEVGHEASLWVLVFLSVFSVAFIFERWLFLKKVRGHSQKAMEHIQSSLKSSQLEDLEKLTKNHQDSLEGKALSYGLNHLKSHGSSGLEEVFSTFILLERPRLEKYLNFLATVGSNAPFIGLLGTVFGIMDAFRALSASDGDPHIVMLGISKALVATAVGLLVAIPAVVAYNYFQKQVRGSLQSLKGVQSLCTAYGKNIKG